MILFLISCSVIAGTIRMSRGIKDSLLSNQKQCVHVTSTGFTLSCPLQNLEADIHPDGVTIRSNSATEGIGNFSIVPISLGRKISQATINSNSIIST
ncbi:MAG TPA: hypothetical protein VHO70_19205 [Chitinispirillaceae bacterium]|nr:hypothetical protein [Chitinispirillaceae bacterium]